MTPKMPDWGATPDYNHLYQKMANIDMKLSKLIDSMNEMTRVLETIEANQSKVIEASKQVMAGGGAVIVRM